MGAAAEALDLAAARTGLDGQATGIGPVSGTGPGGPDQAGVPSFTGPGTGVGPGGARAAHPAPSRRWIRPRQPAAAVEGRPASSRRWITVGLPVICLISLVIYPIRYDDLLSGQVFASLLLVVRNLLLVIVCWSAVGEVARAVLPRPGRRFRRPRPRS